MKWERSPKSLKNLVTLCDLGLAGPSMVPPCHLWRHQAIPKPTLVHQDPGHRNESQGENLRERHLGDFITILDILVSSLIIFPMMRPFFLDSDSDVDFVER